jgi:hypothetical protein
MAQLSLKASKYNLNCFDCKIFIPTFAAPIYRVNN